MCRLRRRLATQMIKHVPPAEKVNNSSATEQKVGLERSCNKMTTVNASNVSVASNTTESCVIVDTFAFSHFSAAVAAVILVFLSLFEKRTSRRCCRGDNDCTRGRPGLLVPVNLLTAGRDRWAYAYALGASTNMCLLLFFNAFQDQASGFYVSSETTETSAWINQLIALACAVEVGLCFFPFLACLKTRYRLIGAPIGLGYSLVWLAVTVIDTVQCIGDRSAWDDSSTLSTVAPYMGLLWSLPVIVCLIILMVKFTILMVGSLKSWCKEGCGSLVDKESEKIAQDFDFLYVRTLLVKKEEPAKLPWYRRCCRRRPDDGFRFSARMTTTMVVSLLCLYELAIYEIQAVSIGLEILRRVYQNATQNFLEINGQVVVGANTTSVDNVLFATQVSWIVSGVTAFLVHIVYVFIIMGAYRRHVRLLYRGDTSWMPASYQPSTAVSITAGMKYSGSQIAFILWGFIIQQVTFLVICAAVYICILFPDLMLRLLDYFGPVTAVSLTTLLVQRIMATVLFSQSKVNKKDKDRPLAIDNRRLYHITSYFLFFFNLMVGFFSSVWRLLLGGLMGAMLQARIDHSVLMRILEHWDTGFKSYLGMLRIEVAHTHPVLLVFVQQLVDATRTEEGRSTSASWQVDAERDEVKMSVHSIEAGQEFKHRESSSRLPPARFKWLVLYTIFRNPAIINTRSKVLDMEEEDKNAIYEFLVERILASKATTSQEGTKSNNSEDETRSQHTSRTSLGKSTHSLIKVD
ncbi:stimulated by retinoic acid gene 6 protein-like [Branchiostoma lanceolatum]|uniref:stimulated by retinoic acid gene 6 protein-like n=1 Tax=Branchiostoma lanceolatum TaxID=7740 RepID=UPI003456A0E6